MKFKVGRFGFRIRPRNLVEDVMETPDIGKWVMFFPGCWWQVDKPGEKATATAIWEADAKKFLPQCIIDKGYLTKADLEWKGKKCDWKEVVKDNNDYVMDSVDTLRCETCGEIKDINGNIIQVGANTWRKLNEDDNSEKL